MSHQNLRKLGDGYRACEHGSHNTCCDSQGLEYIYIYFPETVVATGLEPKDAGRQLVDIEEFSHLLFLREKKIGRIDQHI